MLCPARADIKSDALSPVGCERRLGMRRSRRFRPLLNATIIRENPWISRRCVSWMWRMPWRFRPLGWKGTFRKRVSWGTFFLFDLCWFPERSRRSALVSMFRLASMKISLRVESSWPRFRKCCLNARAREAKVVGSEFCRQYRCRFPCITLFRTPRGCADVGGMYRNRLVGFMYVLNKRQRLIGSIDISRSRKTTDFCRPSEVQSSALLSSTKVRYDSNDFVEPVQIPSLSSMKRL